MLPVESAPGDSEEEEEEEDEEDLVLDYSDKINFLRQKRNLPLAEPTVQQGIAMSSSSKNVPAELALPVSKNIPPAFETFIQKLKASQEDKTKNFTRNLTNFSTKLSNYKIEYEENNRWMQEGPKDNELLTHKSWNPSEQIPRIKMKLSYLRVFETSNRNTLQIASYTDQFLLGAMDILDTVFSKLNSVKDLENPVLDSSHIADICLDLSAL
jgi:hypothetical protein